MKRTILLTLIVCACLATRPDAYAWYATWQTNLVTVYVNPANAPSWMSADQVVASVQAAMNDWNSQGGANIQLVYGGLTTAGHALDGLNVVSFSPTPKGDGSIAFTFSQWDSSLHLSDSDVVLYLTDGSRTFSYFADDQDCWAVGWNAIYLHDMLTHELGHLLGLEHSDVDGATMHIGYATCSQTQRSLELDDIAGIQALYGATVPPLPDPGTIPPPPITECVTSGVVYPLGSLLSQTVKNGQVGSYVTARETEGWSLIGAKKVKGNTTVTLQCGGE